MDFNAWIYLNLNEEQTKVVEALDDSASVADVTKEITGTDVEVNSFYFNDCAYASTYTELVLAGDSDENTADELKAVLNAFCDHFGCEGYIEACVEDLDYPEDSERYQHTERAGEMKYPWGFRYDDEGDLTVYSQQEVEAMDEDDDDFPRMYTELEYLSE